MELIINESASDQAPPFPSALGYPWPLISVIREAARDQVVPLTGVKCPEQVSPSCWSFLESFPCHAVHVSEICQLNVHFTVCQSGPPRKTKRLRAQTSQLCTEGARCTETFKKYFLPSSGFYVYSTQFSTLKKTGAIKSANCESKEWRNWTSFKKFKNLVKRRSNAKAKSQAGRSACNIYLTKYR